MITNYHSVLMNLMVLKVRGELSLKNYLEKFKFIDITKLFLDVIDF